MGNVFESNFYSEEFRWKFQPNLCGIEVKYIIHKQLLILVIDCFIDYLVLANILSAVKLCRKGTERL